MKRAKTRQPRTILAPETKVVALFEALRKAIAERQARENDGRKR